ncbi:PhzF family phenazine biosynthesis protein [Luteimonas kalidii]|uniref:PhzF family phenazine biosynthesis isomerase n=1 Tax=Luteimonas kalidii TaxID=3042025 RepID=A0ABT6JU19_9GAMM|nr:PhzF family phenazine biosynthesis isomerase [Luteimonas kalidii]MDH5833983.1 PhzF family phenazine biosynthesis isomerase [Luteimonas kalidii]
MSPRLLRYAAFSRDPAGGNPAGVWIGDSLPAKAEMQRIAARVGYSETAFVAAPDASGGRQVRYFSPVAEVPFCGHATIAAAVALGDLGESAKQRFQTAAGEVEVRVSIDADGRMATLVSVPPRHAPVPGALLRDALAALDWGMDELDPAIPPALAFAGAWHLVLAAGDRQRLAALEYDFERLATVMRVHDLTTLQLVWRERVGLFHARNPFPVGGVVEDPATGAAAAALGGYLRDAGLVDAPARLTIHQGEAMGRPGRLQVDIPASGGIAVSGHAIPIPDASAGDVR